MLVKMVCAASLAEYQEFAIFHDGYMKQEASLFRICTKNPFASQAILRKVKVGWDLAERVRESKEKAFESFSTDVEVVTVWRRLGANISVVRAALKAVTALIEMQQFSGDSRDERLVAWTRDIRVHIYVAEARFEHFRKAVEWFATRLG